MTGNVVSSLESSESIKAESITDSFNGGVIVAPTRPDCGRLMNSITRRTDSLTRAPCMTLPKRRCSKVLRVN